MIELFVLDDDLEYCKKLINNIGMINKKVRVSFISNNIQELPIMSHIDIIIANHSFAEDLKSLKISKSHIIYISDEENIVDNNITPIYKNNIKLILRKLTFIANKISDIHLENLIYLEIKSLDYNFSHVGTSCISESIKLLFKSDTNQYDNNLEKDIYPIVGKKFNVSSATVKGNINYATNKMLDECDKAKLSKYLGYNVSYRPGSKTIMCAIVRQLKMKI